MEGDLFDPTLWSVAEADGRVVGSISGILFPDTGWIRPLAVARSHRRRGIALALLQRTFRELHRRGAIEVGLIVDADNQAGATRLYERAGMHPEREYLNYEKTVGVDGL
jgi:mycothiol synthase